MYPIEVQLSRRSFDVYIVSLISTQKSERVAKFRFASVRIFFVAFTVTQLILNICNFDFLIFYLFSNVLKNRVRMHCSNCLDSQYISISNFSISRTNKGHKQGQELLLLFVISKKKFGPLIQNFFI